MTLRSRARSLFARVIELAEGALAPPAPPTIEEVATADDSTGELVEFRDEVLREHGKGDLALYERLLSDDQVYSTFRQRRTEVIAREWRCEPGGDSELDKLAADDLREQMAAVGWDRASFKMLAGLMCGYGVAECMFALDGSDHVALSAIKVRRSARFRFARDGGLRIMRKGKPTAVPPRKFWVYSCGADSDDDPHGLGLGNPLYWPVWFKRNGYKFWAQFLEWFANPIPKATVPAGTDETERSKLITLLGHVRHGGRIVIPRGVDVELIQAMRSSGGDFDLFCTKLDGSIAKIVLMQTMTTDQGSSLSQAEVHWKVGQAGAKGDADLLDESFTRGPATWLTEWNHPGAKVPRIYRDFTLSQDLKEIAARDQILSGIGYRPRPDYVAETYGDNYDFVPPPDPFAQPGLPPPGGDDGGDDAVARAGASALTLAPTDIANVVTVNEARSSQGLGTLTLPDGSPDPDGILTISEFKAKRAAKAELTGEAAAGVPANPPAFAESLPLATDSVERLVGDGGWRAVIGPEVERIEALLAECRTLPEFRDRLGDLALVEPEALTESLARVMFAAALAGGAGAEEEGGGEP